MKYILVLFFCFLCVNSILNTTCNSPQNGDRRDDKNQLTIITYNPEWLFLANEEDPSSCPEAGCPYKTLEEALSHVQDIAKELQKINADIVNLIEVEGCEVLETLVSFIGEEYGYKYYLTPGTDTFTGQNVALLTKIDPIIELERTDERTMYPVSNSTCSGTIESDDYGVSKNYYTKFNVNGTIVNLFSIHFLAIPDDNERCFKREAQATVMANYMEESVKSGENVIILGDMNDYDSRLEDINDDTPISNVLYILSNPFTNTQLFNGEALFNIGTTVPFQDQRFSCWYDRNDDCSFEINELSVIDHTLIDSNLKNTIFSHARYVHSYLPTCNTAISDHYPVLSKYDFN